MNAAVNKCGGIWRAFQLLETFVNLFLLIGLNPQLTVHFKMGINAENFPTPHVECKCIYMYLLGSYY